MVALAHITKYLTWQITDSFSCDDRASRVSKCVVARALSHFDNLLTQALGALFLAEL